MAWSERSRGTDRREATAVASRTLSAGRHETAPPEDEEAASPVLFPSKAHPITPSSCWLWGLAPISGLGSLAQPVLLGVQLSQVATDADEHGSDSTATTAPATPPMIPPVVTDNRITSG